MKNAPQTHSWLSALGADQPPATIRVAGAEYQHEKTFKHDFFAATALYYGQSGKVVLKAGRTFSLFGLPMAWLGRVMANHESRLYRLAAGVNGIPKLVGSYGTAGLVHDYVEGRPLQRDDRPGDDFFPKLAALVAELHERGIAVVDLEKPENILLGHDGNPHLIDFQISWHIPAARMGKTWPARLFLNILQSSDRYHVLKHWRKLRPDQSALMPDGASHQIPIWIRWHRALFRPLTLARRQILVWMGLSSSIRVRSPG